MAQILEKKGIEHKMSAFISSATFLILKRIKQGSIMNVHRSWCKAPVFLSDFSQILIFETGFQKIKKYQIS